MPDGSVSGSLLAVKGLHAWYGESHILHGVDFEVRRGEVVTLLGRNGVGKTTTMKSIMGMVARREGSITFEGKETIALPSNRIARLGIAICPEERGIFASLTVLENLLLPPKYAKAVSTCRTSSSCSLISENGRRVRARSSPAANSRCSP